MILPRYPVYIPTKGRWEQSLTANFLLRDEVPFRLVIEQQEFDQYAAKFGEKNILVLPFSNLGQGSIPARNWIKNHATEEGHLRHWQLDDNMRQIRRVWKGKRVPCNAGVALACTEDFIDRYENVAIAGLNYTMFMPQKMQPFLRNVHVYSCTLVLNSIPHQWRGRYNEDTDLCLQVLSDGWCTVSMNIFCVDKMQTMTMKGGNSDELYKSDGRLKMSRSLERVWPGVVSTSRRWDRPQHQIYDAWKRFDTPLKLKPGIDLSKLGKNEYGMVLTEVKEVKNDEFKKFLKEPKIRSKQNFAGGPIAVAGEGPVELADDKIVGAD